MSLDAKLALRGYVPPEQVLAWVKQNFDPNATSTVAFKERKKPSFQVYEYYRPDKKWVIQSGFIKFVFKGESRSLFYYYSSINIHENEELYEQAWLMDMVMAEKTFLILGHWGACDQVMRSLITCAGGAWYDENDCDGKEYEWFTVEKAQEKEKSRAETPGRKGGSMKNLKKLLDEKTLYYWCNAVGDLNILGYPVLACPTADKLPPDVREVYEKYWVEFGWGNRYVVTCDGETGLLLNYLFDHNWMIDMIEENEVGSLSDEDRSKLLHIAVDAAVGVVEEYIRSKTEKRFEILVGHDTDPDGDELGVFFPLSELENNSFGGCGSNQTRELFELVYKTVEFNIFHALRGEPAGGYDVTLYYGYVDSHDSYDVYHSFELEDPEGAHDENMGAKLAELLDTTAEDEDFRWKSMSVKLPESLVERIQEDAVWGKLRKEKDTVRAYGLYKLWWMIDRGYTLNDIAEELREMRYEDPDDFDRIATPDTTLYDEWESEKGFGGETFPEYAEFLAKWKSGDRK